MDVIIDLIQNLEDGKYLDFKTLSNKPRRLAGCAYIYMLDAAIP